MKAWDQAQWIFLYFQPSSILKFKHFFTFSLQSGEGISPKVSSIFFRDTLLSWNFGILDITKFRSSTLNWNWCEIEKWLRAFFTLSSHFLDYEWVVSFFQILVYFSHWLRDIWCQNLFDDRCQILNLNENVQTIIICILMVMVMMMLIIFTIQRTLREIRILLSLKHENIIDIR